VATEDFKRKLTAIFSADVAGYSRLMGEDEAATVKTLASYREVMASLIKQHRGRVVDSPGDNVLAEFVSVVDAVQCAVAVQKELQTRNAELPENRRMEFRIGINLGDVIEEEDRIYGDGVNIAARLEALADPGGICISKTAFDQIETKLPLGYEFMGEQDVKNIAKPVGAYRVLMDAEAAGKVIGEIRPKTKQLRGVVIGAVAVLIIVAGALAVWNFYLRPPFELASKERMAFPLPDKPSIAVLPFENLSGDPEQEYIADGISENMITALCNISEMFVIARNSTFSYKGKSVRVQQVAEELGVRYVLEGSVQRANDQIRITAQLVDAITGHHLWAERYDRHLKDLFAMQDEITLKIVTAMQVELTEGEQARLWKPPNNFEAWGYLVRAGDFFQRFRREYNARAQQLLEQAVKLDPEYSTAWTLLAWTYVIDAWLGFTDSRTESMKKAMLLGEKAMALDASQPVVHSLWGTIYLVQKQWEKAISEGRKAITLGPNDALSHLLLANTLLFAGKFDESIALAERAVRLAPYCPDFYLSILAQAYRQAGRYDDALAMYTKALDRARKNKGNVVTPRIGLVDVCVHLDRKEEAQIFASEILRIFPDFSLDGFSSIYAYKNPAHMERILANLRKAGLPKHPPLPLPDKPSIAVLPFVNMSGDPEQEYFSDGITEEIITALSKTPKLFVIARTSSFKYKGKEVDVRTVGRELGVRHVLEGSVRRATDKVRITAQLIDAKTGNHVWAERYDREIKDIFGLQDEITKKVIIELQVQLTAGEEARLWAKGTDNLEAYLKYLQGLEHKARFNKEENVLTRRMAEEAIALDPHYSHAYELLGFTHMMDLWLQTSKSPAQSIRRAIELAQKAIVLDSSNAVAYGMLGFLFTMAGQHEKGIAEGEKAVDLDPNSAMAHQLLGLALRFGGRPNDAIPVIEKAIRLDPFAPSNYTFNLGLAYLFAGQHEKAIQQCKKATDREPNNLGAHLALAAAYSVSGQDEEARAAAAEIIRIAPKFSVEYFSRTLVYKNQADKEIFVAALRKAGLK